MRTYEAFDFRRLITFLEARTAGPGACGRVIMGTRLGAGTFDAYGIADERGPYAHRLLRSHNEMMPLQRADDSSPAHASLDRFA